MFNTQPPAYIKDYQAYNYVPIEEIPEHLFDEVKKRIERLQSEDPYVSIVLIAYNEQDYVFATLMSISYLESKYPIEIIVVNNNSTDNTQEFLDRCGVRTVFEKAQGYAHARQAGLMEARGKYVISGDTDTLYPKGWVDPMVKPMEEDEKTVCTYGNFRFYTDDHNYNMGLWMYEKARTVDINIKSIQRPHLNVRGFSMAFRRDLAVKLGGYNTKIYRGSDGYLGIELLDLGKLRMVKDIRSRVYTNMRRTLMDGGLFQSFKKKFFTTSRRFFRMLTPQKER